MYKIFFKAFVWNSSIAFIYKIALLSHQIMLYSIISHTLYGLQNTLFAMIYTIIALTNFGFDDTLIPFFAIFSQSKQQFWQVCLHFIWHMVMVIGIAFVVGIIMIYAPGEFLHNIRIHCNKNIIFILIMLFFVESIKKSCVAILQLAFLHKQVAYAQISMLIIYISLVWAKFAIYSQLSLYDLFMPMLMTSCIELFYLFYNLSIFYNKLPDHADVFKVNLRLVTKERMYNYINQIIKVIYSPNSITIFFSYILGFPQAATIKLFTNIITLCYTCISKSIGVTIGATFSAMKRIPFIEMQSLFKDITHKYFQFLSILSCILITIISYAYYHAIVTQTMGLHILLFFMISFFEHISITYEQLFIAQHAAQTLACINFIGLMILCIFGYAYVYAHVNQIIIICIFILVKSLLLLTLRFFAKKRWGIY